MARPVTSRLICLLAGAGCAGALVRRARGPGRPQPAGVAVRGVKGRGRRATVLTLMRARGQSLLFPVGTGGHWSRGAGKGCKE